MSRMVDILLRPNSNKSGPSVQFVENCKAVGLLSNLEESVFSGDVYSKTEWKCKVKRRIDVLEGNEWKASTIMASNLHEYKQVVTDYKNGFPWWIVAKWNNKMLPKVKKLLKYMTMNIKECTGGTCECGVQISLAHILFECQSIGDHIVTEWASVKQRLPVQMSDDLNNMTSVQKASYILSCFNSKPMREWQGIYEKVLQYCDNVITRWTNANVEKE